VKRAASSWNIAKAKCAASSIVGKPLLVGKAMDHIRYLTLVEKPNEFGKKTYQ